jgi:hypothetical protein
VLGAPRIGASGAVRPFYNRAASGIPAAPPTFVSSNGSSYSDPFRVGPGSTFTPPGLAMLAGDLMVVCIGVRGCLNAPTTPGVAIDGGGAPVVTLAVQTANVSGTVDAFIFYITGAAAGFRSITITGAGAGPTIPTGMSAVLYVLRGAAAAPLDKVAQASGLGTMGPYTAGPTAALTVPNQFDINALAIGAIDDEDPRPWVAPFVFRDAGVPITDASTDVATWTADRTSLTTAAVTAVSGTPADPLDFATVLATFKGA